MSCCGQVGGLGGDGEKGGDERSRPEERASIHVAVRDCVERELVLPPCDT